MAKTDIKDAFRIIPIHPDDYHFLDFKLNGNFYYDCCLPMEVSSSCQIFSRFSDALQWIMLHRYNAQAMSHILDDYFFIGPEGSKSCINDLNAFIALCDRIGVPLKEEKTHLPFCVITIYGIEVDLLQMESRLPNDKVAKIRYALLEMRHRKKVTLRELQSLIGLLNFACSIIRPGRAFLRRLIDHTCGIRCPTHKIRLNCEAR